MATISKQFFEDTARVFRDSHKNVDGGQAEAMRLLLAVRLGKLFKSYNVRFDPTRFLKACNPDAG